MRSIRSTVERRFESYSGSLFSAMKTEYVVVAEQERLATEYRLPLERFLIISPVGKEP